jgi:hypothetical protein
MYVCMCLCMYICMFVCIYVGMCLCMYVSIDLCLYLRLHENEFTFLHVYFLKQKCVTSASLPSTQRTVHRTLTWPGPGSYFSATFSIPKITHTTIVLFIYIYIYVILATTRDWRAQLCLPHFTLETPFFQSLESMELLVNRKYVFPP